MTSDAPDGWTWRAGPVTGPAAVFDLDGVLSDAAGRQHYLDTPSGEKDWRAFFDACGDDPLIEEVNRLLELLDRRLAVVLLTARPARVEDRTVAWLERYRVRWDLLVMRPDDERHHTTVEYKRRAAEGVRKVGLEPLLAFEDDRRNVAMFRDLGIPCVYIHSGYYE